MITGLPIWCDGVATSSNVFFFRMKMRETCYDSVEALHADLDAWLVLLQHRAPPSRLSQHGPTAQEAVMSFVS
jgi:hypothetical protein